MSGIVRGLLVGLLFGMLVVALGPPPARAAEGEDPVEARAFRVRYRSTADAAELIGGLLSAEGSLTLKPQLRVLLVEDRASVLRRIESVLRTFDLPPRRVDVSVSLILGRREDDPESGSSGPGQPLSKQVRGILDSVRDFTKWTSYEPLGTRSITGVEGEPVVAELAGDYRVSFVVDSVHESQGVTRVRFDRFALQREITLGDGGRRIEDLYAAGMVVDAQKLTLVVAASAPDAKRALFLALQVEPR